MALMYLTETQLLTKLYWWDHAMQLKELKGELTMNELSPSTRTLTETKAGQARLEQHRRLTVVEEWVKDGFVTLDVTRSAVKATVAGVEYEEPRKEFPSEQFVANAFLLIGAAAAKEKDYQASDHMYTWQDYK